MFLKNSTIAPFLQYVLFLLIIVFVGLSSYYLIYIGNKNVEEQRKININWKNILKIILIGMLIVFVKAMYKEYPILGSTTFAVFISVLLAYLLNPIVNYLEQKGIKRGLGTIITYISILLIFVFLGIAIIPDLIKQSTNFIVSLPSSINKALISINDTLQNWNINPKVLESLRTNVNDYLLRTSNSIPTWISTLITTLQGSIEAIIIGVLIPIITYYFIVDKDKIIKSVYSLIPPKIRPDAKYLYKEINFAMFEFIKSRALMSVFIGVATWIMLEIFGIPFALIIGLITMFVDIIPYVGPILATVPALAFALIKSPILFLWIGFLSFVLQWIEQNIVGAKLMSVSSGIHEVVILISIIIGGGIFGVWGMILSVPFVIIINILINFTCMKINGVTPKFNQNSKKYSNKK
ncbi:AI-2E family transporter [Helcococcus ovis]|uniref:AI-2E family transporter n=1 Tax=Helcococcus ovis TaxID=72026 RepID=UPI0010704030|nr:AI-2E family transporter [Helcococcus ovis]TFF67755.1 AI-2E family transporter [Helcococcus ovis]WNZ01387.1 AI-2E family transporter [Helcococcus ovis]